MTCWCWLIGHQFTTRWLLDATGQRKLGAELRCKRSCCAKWKADVL